MTQDEKIWDDFRKGEKSALSYIYQQNVQLLYRYGKKFSLDDELIKDTIQDLFCDLIESRKHLGKTDNITFYLIASFRRKLARNNNKQLLFVERGSEKQMEAGVANSAEEEIIKEEVLTYRYNLVQKGLMELSPKQREILFYRFHCNMDYEQICEIMSLKYDSARKQVCRALKALKQCLS